MLSCPLQPRRSLLALRERKRERQVPAVLCNTDPTWHAECCSHVQPSSHGRSAGRSIALISWWWWGAVGSWGPLCHLTQPVAKGAVMQFLFIWKLDTEITASKQCDPNFQSYYSSSKSDEQRAAALSQQNHCVNCHCEKN